MSQEQEARERRATRNQSLFRDLNEQIEKLQRSAMYTEFACECCDESCAELVPLTIEEYETVRHESNSFLVLRGHEEPARERVIAEGDRFVVVAKTGAGAALAEELDPRALEVPANKGVTTRELPRQEEVEELALRFVQLARLHAAQANRVAWASVRE